MTSCARPCRQFNGGDITLQPVLLGIVRGWICSSRSNIKMSTLSAPGRGFHSLHACVSLWRRRRGDEGFSWNGGYKTVFIKASQSPPRSVEHRLAVTAITFSIAIQPSNALADFTSWILSAHCLADAQGSSILSLRPFDHPRSARNTLARGVRPGTIAAIVVDAAVTRASAQSTQMYRCLKVDQMIHINRATSTRPDEDRLWACNWECSRAND